MQVNMGTIKTTAFALKYKLKGYKLLQNPKGTNPKEVVMMKDWFGFHGEHYDKFYHYKRVHRKIEDDKVVIEKKFLMSEYLMDPETKTYSGKKNILYDCEKDGKILHGNKESMSMREMEERPFPKWENENDEFYFGMNLFEENRKQSYYCCTRPNIFQRAFAQGIYGYRVLIGHNVNGPFRPNFWQILKSNINGGGMA